LAEGASRGGVGDPGPFRLYREEPTKGAPDAVRVADRWCLLHNLVPVLEEFLLQKSPVLRKAAMPEAVLEEKGEDTFAPGR